jgi:hypothetical protein
MTHIRHYFTQRLGKDVWEYCIVPFLLPCEESVKANFTDMITDLNGCGIWIRIAYAYPLNVKGDHYRVKMWLTLAHDRKYGRPAFPSKSLLKI